MDRVGIEFRAIEDTFLEVRNNGVHDHHIVLFLLLLMNRNNMPERDREREGRRGRERDREGADEREN